ncbi:MAG: N-acetylglucosamine-6-phosphate deacetylase [Lachnospiraceae bacterium]|nr:N-acetylglucosamine-6-phosphate deacetylase [Lachnospiraceae bacterium]
MNIFYEGRFVRGEFDVKDGRFADVRVLGEEDPKDPDYVIPGYVEIHSHGRTGADFSFADDDTVRKLAESYAACGVTSVLATTMTNDPKIVEKSIEAAGRAADRGPENREARILGVHMEGPFLGKDKKGAHDENFLCDFDKIWLDKIIEKSNNNIKMISVDPNLSGSSEFIREYTKRGIVISIAHTSSDYDTAVKAVEAGADHVTHLFNAMNPLNHRAPGVIGAAFDKRLFSELICDGIHVNPTLIRMQFRLMPDRMIIISDSMQAAGLCDGTYSLGGIDVFVKNGKAVQADGTIAGSTTDISKEVENVISFGIAREEAILAATLNPARSVRAENRVGRIAKGCMADYLITDGDLNIKNVIINGRTI